MKSPQQKYYEKNREKIISQMRARYVKNKERYAQYRKDHYDSQEKQNYNKLYYAKNTNKIKEKNKEWSAKNAELVAQKKLEYRIKNRERLAKEAKVYRKENHAAVIKRNSAYQKKKLLTDIQWKIRFSLRSRMRMALMGRQKSAPMMRLLGCSIEEVKKYLEDRFQEGMTWENYGFYGWHIDHIIPCASFDLTDPEQQKKCFHYSNLQPLWAKDNLSKGAKV